MDNGTEGKCEMTTRTENKERNKCLAKAGAFNCVFVSASPYEK